MLVWMDFIDKKLPYLRNFDVPVIVNICGEQVEEYLEVTEKLDAANGVAAIELNISCPNLHCGGMSFGVDPKLTGELVRGVRERTTLPLLGQTLSKCHRYYHHCPRCSGCRC